MDMSEQIQTSKTEHKKRKKLPFFVVMVIAFSGFMLARGVIASSSNSIILTGGTALFGGDDASATSCDESITIRRTAEYNSATNLFEIATIAISGINQAELNGCGNQTLQLAVAIGNGVTQQASWTIPSTSTPQTFYLSAWSTNSSALSNYYADILLTPFNASQAISTKYALNTFRTPY